MPPVQGSSQEGEWRIDGGWKEEGRIQGRGKEGEWRIDGGWKEGVINVEGRRIESGWRDIDKADGSSDWQNR